jgi:hypothetical protein
MATALLASASVRASAIPNANCPMGARIVTLSRDEENSPS